MLTTDLTGHFAQNSRGFFILFNLRLLVAFFGPNYISGLLFWPKTAEILKLDNSIEQL